MIKSTLSFKPADQPVVTMYTFTLNRSGWRLRLVTNLSEIARSRYTECPYLWEPNSINRGSRPRFLLTLLLNAMKNPVAQEFLDSHNILRRDVFIHLDNCEYVEILEGSEKS